MGVPPLAGCRVLLTRPVEQAQAWHHALDEAGATVVAYPTIEVRPPPSWAPLDAALAQLASYDWLVFTSAAAVRFTCSRLPASAGGSGRPAIAAVGARTAAALAERGLSVALVPGDERQEGLITAFADLRAGTRVLFPQALGGREELTLALRGAGCVVEVVPASQTVAVAPLPPLPAFDVATFASPSALAAFIDAHGTAALTAAAVVVIGATTAAAARAQGLDPTIAAAARPGAIIDAIAAVLQARRPADDSPADHKGAR
jgi:uroporphyrinogen III methyltransferase/synthase